MKTSLSFLLRLKLQVFMVLFLSVLSELIYAQPQPQQDLYYVGILQRHSSWSECSGSKPTFSYVNVKTDTRDITINGSSNLSKIIQFYTFTNADPSKVISSMIEIENISVKVRTEAIENDKELNFKFLKQELKIGKNVKSGSASDPCSNWANWSGDREGYYTSTEIYIDDPVHIFCNQYNGENSLDLPDDQYLKITVGNFYENGKGSPELWVSYNNSQQKKVENIIIRPNTELWLSYKDIFASDITKYGEPLTFWVEKRLLNGVVTKGKKIENIRFYPRGIPFNIESSVRKACDGNSINLFIRPDNSSDFDRITPDKYKCAVSIVNVQPSSGFEDCTMEKQNDGRIKLNFNNTSFEIGDELSVRLFNVFNPNEYFTSAEFTIPPVPDYVTATQIKKQFDVGGDKYDVPGSDPFLLLQINDAHDRIPYKFFIGTTPVETLGGLPTPYEDLTTEEQGRIRDRFNEYFTHMVSQRENPYKTFFETKLQEWVKLPEAKEPVKLYNGSGFAFLPDNRRFLFIKDGSIYLGNINGEKETFVIDGQYLSNIVVNPNGLFFYYIVYENSKYRLYRMSLKDGSRVRMVHPDYNVFDIRLASDGFVYFRSNGDLYKINSMSSADQTPINVFKSQYVEWSDQLDPGTGELFTTYYYDTRVDFLSSSGDWYVYTENNMTGNNDNTIEQPFSLESLTYAHSTFQDRSMRIREYARIKSNTHVDYNSNASNYVFAPNGYYLLCEDNDMIKKISLINFNETTTLFEGYNPIYIFQDNTSFLYLGLDGVLRKSCVGCSTVQTIFSNVKPSKVIVNPYENCFLYTPQGQYNTIYAYFHNESQIADYYRNKLYPNNGEPASLWYDEFYNQEWERWKDLYSYIAIEHPAIKANVLQTLTVTDGDGCSFDMPFTIDTPPPLNFKIETTKATNPCSADGTATLTYLGGGNPPYIIGTDEIKTVGNSAFLQGLPVGRNKVTLKDNYEITFVIEPNNGFSYEVIPSTCHADSGEISFDVAGVSGNRSYYLYKNLSLYDSINTDKSSEKFTGLTDGKYTLEVYQRDGCKFKQEGIKVENEIFDFSLTSTNPTELDGTGSVKIDFVNRKSLVQWSITPVNYSSTTDENSVSYGNLRSGKYTVKAIHNGCEVEKEFYIDGPQVNADIKLNQSNGSLFIDASISGYYGLGNFKLRLEKQGSTIKESTSSFLMDTLAEANSDYSIKLYYGANSEYGYQLCSFTYPLGNIGNAYEMKTSIKCNGGQGVVELKPTGGIDGGTFSVKLDENGFSNNMTYSVGGGALEYILRSQLVDNTSNINKTYSITTWFVDTIPQPDLVSATVIPIDVTCNGSANGSISLSSLTGGSGVYQYRIKDDGNWKNPSESFTSLPPGEYSVYLKDSQNNCADVYLTNVPITQPERLELERQVVIQPKCELNNGSILAEIKGGNGFYRYEWLLENQPFYKDPVFSSPDSFVSDTIYSLGDTLRSGHYRLKVVDNRWCELIVDTTLQPYHNPNVDLTSVDARCYGESNGEVKLSNYSGSGVFTHSTISSSTAANFSTIANPNGSFQNLTHGVYTVSVFDDKGCSAEFGATVRQPNEPLTAVASVLQPVLTIGTATGIIRSTISGGNDGLKTVTLKNSLGETVVSSQQPGSFPFIMNSLYAGNYKVTVVDRKGCEFISDPIQVLEPTSVLGFTVVDKKDALCKSQTGSFTVQATGGWGDYKYKRSTQNSFYNSGKFENLYAGNYVVTVKDKFGATYTGTVFLYEPKERLGAWVAELNNPTCVDNGSLVLGLNGGTAGYKIYNLTNNDSLEIPDAQLVPISGLSAGDNQFRVVDANGCRFNLETNLNNSHLLQVTFDTPTYPSTSASSDGALRAVVTGGKSPYSYQWSSLFGTPVAGNSATLSNIPSGHYEVNVAEANGCSVAKDIYLPNINDLPLKICYKHDESAYGASNGYCTLTSPERNWSSFYIVTPSKQKLTFNPSDSTSMFDFRTDSIFLTNLVGGNYFVAGMVDGAKYYAEFTIKPYELFSFGKVDVLNVSTIGASNGKITVDVIGGGGGNQFRWERIVGAGAEPQVSQDNEDNSVLSDISAGNYRVTVTDYFGNSISKDVEVDEPSSALMISVAESTNESCKDYTDAFVRLSAGGGWGDYQFRSQKSEYFDNSSLFSDLEVGTHRFYITDRMGAVDSVEVNITEPSYLTSRIVSIDSVSCNGAADGRVEFAVNGGTAPYRFADIDQSNLWIDDSAKGQLPAGKYRYIFTDNNNCIGQDTVEVVIPQPDSLLFNSIAVVHTTCEQDNGSIKVDLKGGTLPYRYEWLDSGNKPVGSQNSVGNLMRGGNYTLKVFDKNNCYQELKQRIETSTNPTVTNITTTDVVCYGESNGTATVQNYQYGSPIAPLTFTWSNGNTGLSASGYAKGTHYVTVTDTNNCSTVKYFDVVQPDSLRIAIVNSKMPKCFGYSDALIEATGVGGVGGYRYLWSTGADTSVLSNVSKGDYGLLVTDANNCEVYGIYSVGEPEELEVDLGDDILMCPGNTRVIDGQEFATHKWSTSQGEVSTERYFTVSQADSYFLEVTDNIGCLAHDTIAVAIGNNALVADFLVSSQVELTDTLMLFELSNMPLDSMRWDYSNSAFLKVDGDIVLDYIIYLKTLSKGIYNIDLYAYSGGCVSVATKQVEIVEDLGGNPDDDGLGYNDPLIKEFTVNPNPNTGDFTATVKLREVANINLVLFSVASGIKVNERFEYQLQDYSVPYNLVNLNSGVYLLIVKAGNERRQVKIVIQ